MQHANKYKRVAHHNCHDGVSDSPSATHVTIFVQRTTFWKVSHALSFSPMQKHSFALIRLWPVAEICFTWPWIGRQQVSYSGFGINKNRNTPDAERGCLCFIFIHAPLFVLCMRSFSLSSSHPRSPHVPDRKLDLHPARKPVKRSHFTSSKMTSLLITPVSLMFSLLFK